MLIGGISIAQPEGIGSFQYISPRHGAKLVSPYNNIIIRQGEILDKSVPITNSLIEVKGSFTGIHSGKFFLSNDYRTLIFNPDQPFSLGEIVTVKLGEGLKTSSGAEVSPLRFNFTITTISGEETENYLREHYINEFSNINHSKNKSVKMAPTYQKNEMANNSLPEIFPEITVTTHNNPTPGYLFMVLFYVSPDSLGPTVLAITDNYGTPIFYRRYDGITFDLKVQPNGLLTFYNGNLFASTAAERRFLVMDQSYAIVDTIRAGNGYTTDLHELLVLPNGHALLMSYDPQPVRMDTIVPGGDPNAIVTGLIIQELDVSKNVVFQWRSWDHFQITDADSNVDLTAGHIDYVHGNAIDVDYDGNLLISCRKMNEITKIDRLTGDIIWRWGGENNQFTFVNDNRGFSRQHHIRRIKNGNYTLFDNGNFLSPQHSSALEYQIDEQNMTATLVWSYRDPNIYGQFMGSTQRLPNGNTVIGWGGTFGAVPAITEIRQDGFKELEIVFKDPYVSYRAKRFFWETNLFFTDLDTISFYNYSQAPDTAFLNLLNNTSDDIIITTTTTRTSEFSVIDTLPVIIPANANAQISLTFIPSDTGIFNDVLTIRADKETEGFGRQVFLSAEYHTSGITDESPTSPKRFALHQNYPNPFNPTTTISYKLKTKSDVQLTIYDISGRKIKTLVKQQQNAGQHSVTFDASGLASGIYFYRLKTSAGFVQSRKMVVLK